MENHIYIASTLSNAPRVRQLRDRLATMGIGLTYDWTSHNNGAPYIDDSDPDLKRSIAYTELMGVRQAKAVLVVLPGGCGTHFEMCAAYLWRKPIIMLADHQPDHTPCFHYLSGVQRYYDESTALSALLSVMTGQAKTDHGLDEILRTPC
jgi:hypothetical protein